MYVLFVLISFRAGHCACKNTAKLTHTVQYSELDGYPSHSPKWRIRPLTLSSTLIDMHPNFKQLRTTNVREPQFVLVLDIRLAQH